MKGVSLVSFIALFEVSISLLFGVLKGPYFVKSGSDCFKRQSLWSPIIFYLCLVVLSRGKENLNVCGACNQDVL